MSQENLGVAKAFFDAYSARNSEAMDRLLHPDAKMTTLSAKGLGGHWRQGTTSRYSSSSTRRGPTFASKSRTTAKSVSS